MGAQFPDRQGRVSPSQAFLNPNPSSPVLPLADATIYVTGAQALALGHGYRLLGYLAEPPSTMYPPGYSLLLAPLFALWPDLFRQFPILELTSLLAFYALLALSALVLRRCLRASTTDTALAILLAATTPMALLMSTEDPDNVVLHQSPQRPTLIRPPGRSSISVLRASYRGRTR